MISVCIATYNGERFLKEQLSSILCQLGKDDEVIVSDDGSSDETINIVTTFQDTRIRLLHNTHKHGFVGNFENALSNVKGDYVFLSDQDDVWMPNKVERVASLLAEYDLVVHDAELIDGNGKQLGKTYYSTQHGHTDFLMNLWKSRFLGCCMAFRRSLLEQCLPFPQEIVAHDYWIGMYALLKHKVLFIPDILIKYRRHGGNVSPSSEKSDNSLFYKLYTKRWRLLCALMTCK